MTDVAGSEEKGICLSACVAEEGDPRGLGSQRQVMRSTIAPLSRTGSSRMHDVTRLGTSASGCGAAPLVVGEAGTASSVGKWQISSALVGMMGSATMSGESSTKELNIVGSW